MFGVGTPSVPPLLDVQNLSIDIATDTGWTPVVSEVSFAVWRGRTTGIVGESGSGKSVTCQSILGLHPRSLFRVSSGAIRFQGKEISALDGSNLRAYRGAEIGMIFQEPMSSLNPAFTVGNQICEAIRTHRTVSRSECRRQAVRMLDLVGIARAEQRLKAYPHEFSGGMRQRVMIAMALAAQPKLLIADEPTTALDVTVQAQVLDLLSELADRFDMGVLMVSHDLGVLANIADEVVVMYAGQVVERGTTREVFRSPRHPYTEALLSARPSIDAGGKLNVIRGEPPSLGAMPDGCRFASRCAYAARSCNAKVTMSAEGSVRCLRPLAPGIGGPH